MKGQFYKTVVVKPAIMYESEFWAFNKIKMNVAQMRILKWGWMVRLDWIELAIGKNIRSNELSWQNESEQIDIVLIYVERRKKGSVVKKINEIKV